MLSADNTGCCKGERRQWRMQRTEAGAAVAECEGLLPPKHDAGTATRHYRAFWQRRCRATAAGAVLKPSGGNCAVLPKTQIFKEEIKLANKPQIDIPLGEPDQHKPGSKIDISLDDDQPPKLQPDPAPGQILQTEMEIVNRHHEEVREQHRRARVQQEG